MTTPPRAPSAMLVDIADAIGGAPFARAVAAAARPERPLFIPLKAAEFDAFAVGEKTTEYRRLGRNFTLASCRVGRQVTLSRGYGKQARLQGTIVAVETFMARKGQGLDTYGPAATIIAISIHLNRKAARARRGSR